MIHMISCNIYDQVKFIYDALFESDMYIRLIWHIWCMMCMAHKCACDIHMAQKLAWWCPWQNHNFGFGLSAIVGPAIIKKYYILFYFVDIKCSSVVVQYFIFLRVVDLDNIFLLTILIKVKCIYLLMSKLFCFGKFVRNVLLQIYVYYFYFTVLALVYLFVDVLKRFAYPL